MILMTRPKGGPPKPANPLVDLLTMAEVQDILGCSRHKIYGLYQSGQLKLVKWGGQTCVTQASLHQLRATLPPLVLKRSYGPKRKKRSQP
jgi:hypothetical protein